MKFNVCYKQENNTKRVRFEKNAGDDNAGFKVSDTSDGFSLEIIPQKEIILERVFATFHYDFHKNDAVFLNGYQSWTDSHEHNINYHMRGISHIPKSIVKKYALMPYGDYAFTDYKSKKGNQHGFTYGYIRRDKHFDFIGSLCENTGFTAIYFNTATNEITVEKDCRGHKINDPYKVLDIAFLRGEEGEVFDKYFELLKISPPNADKISGFTSWYRYYQNISEDIILENLNAMKNFEHHFDVFQIDDGYQTRVGDWLSVDKRKFPNSMKIIADKIRESDMLPGIWLAPFACEFNSQTAKEHPDWLLKNPDGSLAVGGGNWGGFYVLDFYNENVRSYIKNCFDVIINQWGFKLLKLDFLYAVCMLPRTNKTRGQIMFEAMDFLRECAENALILGCGVPLSAAFDKVEYCRIGCDVGLDFDDKLYMRLLHRERVSTKNSMGNTIFRRQLSGRAFINDPDVFLLRDNDIKLTENDKYNLAAVNSLFGGVLFTSDNLSEYNEKQQKIFMETLKNAKEKPAVKLENNCAVISCGNKVISIRL